MNKGIDLQDYAMRKMELEIQKMDERHLNPDERANFIMEVFQLAIDHDPAVHMESDLYWDLMCFSLGILRSFAQSVQHEDTLEIVKVLNSHFFSMHYSLPKGHECLGPNRSEHEIYWREKIGKLEYLFGKVPKEDLKAPSDIFERKLELIPIEEDSVIGTETN